MVYFLRMKIQATTQQVQKQILAPYIQQSIEVLLLPLLDLNKTIELELQSNPLLEMDEQKTDDLSANFNEDELLQKISHYQSTLNYKALNYNPDDDSFDEKPIKEELNLEVHLIKQLHLEFSDPAELKIGEFILGNLNEDGYMHCTLPEIKEMTGIKDDYLIESVIKKIHTFEPTGIAARDLKECLLLQLEAKDTPLKELVKVLIQDHLAQLGKKKFIDIAKKLKVSQDEIKKALRVISSLEPKPARNYRPLNLNTYIIPDIYIQKTKNGHQLVMNDTGYPALRINIHYKKMLKQNHLNPEEKAFIREKLKQAVYFIKSIHQRGQTLTRITEYILQKQKNFFDEQGPSKLIPLTLKDVAQAIDRNESTISRAINNKYVATPKGTYPLKYFFSKKISDNGSKEVASRSVKEEMQDLIHQENPSKPLSDQDICNYFVEKGLSIARRTITKYRQMMHILPAHLRKK